MHDDDTLPSSPREGVPLAYQVAQPGVSRGAFRLLLLLTLINTILLGWFVLGPQLSGFARQQWADYQQRKIDRQKAAAAQAARLAMLPAQEAAMSYTAPADLVVYADGGTDEERLAAQAAAATQPSGIVWPGTVPLPEPFTQLHRTIPGWGLLVNPEKQVLFLHARTPPGSEQPLLIVVLVEPVTRKRSPRSRNTFRHSEFSQAFTALVLEPATRDRDLSCAEWSKWNWSPAAGLPGDPSTADLYEAAEARLILKAGQPDPSDPSRFTIAYTIDGVEGEIIGQVGHDQKVRLQPIGPMAAGWAQER
jgi:hypothetical protein